MKWKPTVPAAVSSSSARANIFTRRKRCRFKEASLVPASILDQAGFLADFSPLHAAVYASVAKIDEHANDQPTDQAEPGNQRQVGHPPEGKHYAENGHHRNPRRSEWARQVGIATAEHPHTATHDRECQQRADIHHVAQL